MTFIFLESFSRPGKKAHGKFILITYTLFYQYLSYDTAYSFTDPYPTSLQY